MAKILLVEDDNNLREIYEARLQAEGYDIVSARDGEEALTVAMKERPDLIISDVMMPKISGFDMLDIIRSTEETKNVKVIMMTALSQAEDKERATKLGADRYLVKSQVTLEDVAKVAREVLDGASDQKVSTMTAEAPPAVAQAPTVDTPVTPAPVTPVPIVAPEPVAVAEPTVVPAPIVSTDDSSIVSLPAEPVAVSSSPALAAISPAPTVDNSTTSTTSSELDDTEESAIAAQIESFIEVKKTEPEAVVPEITEAPETVNNPEAAPEPTPEPEPSEVLTDASKKTGKIVIQPLSDLSESRGPDLDGLLKKEVEKDQMAEIAKSLANQKSDVVDELTAEAALRSAARVPQNTATEEINDDALQVDITENGDLKVETEGDTVSVAEPAQPQIDTSDVPKVDAADPIIPHSNGSSLDGVIAQPVAVPPAEATVPLNTPMVSSEPPKDDDPNAIAL